MGAWSTAVLFLAKVFIDKEETLYQMAEKREGGWRYFETFEVSKIEQLTNDVKRISFKPPRGSSLTGKKFEFTAGQYLSLKIDPEGNGLTAPRHYTATSPPGADYLQCTIKKIPGGKVSTYVHEKLKVGAKVELAPPYGVFTAEKEESAVLLSAGIGVTPMVNFSRALGDKVKLVVHVDKTKESFPFRSHFEEAGHPMEVVYTKQAGRPSVANLAKVTVARAGANNNFYICGPEKWMEQMQTELLKQGARKVFCEVFGSQLGTGCPFVAGSRVRLPRGTRRRCVQRYRQTSDISSQAVDADGLSFSTLPARVSYIQHEKEGHSFHSIPDSVLLTLAS